VLNKINKEKQRTPIGELISYPVSNTSFLATGVPLPKQENLILRKLEQEGIIKITKKEIENDNLDSLYVENPIVRAVTIPNLEIFEYYRTKLT